MLDNIQDAYYLRMEEDEKDIDKIIKATEQKLQVTAEETEEPEPAGVIVKEGRVWFNQN